MVGNERSRRYWRRLTESEGRRPPIAPDCAEFFAYLRAHNHRAVWDERDVVGGRSEPLEGLYAMLAMCVLVGARQLTITESEITWDIGGEPDGYWPLSNLWSISGREWFRLMRLHDPMVRRHLHVISETPEAIVYRIGGESDDA